MDYESYLQRNLLNFDRRIIPEDVLRVVRVAASPMTRRGIADALGCAKSPSLIAAVVETVMRGWLEVTFYALPNGVNMYVYTITEKGEQAYQYYCGN